MKTTESKIEKISFKLTKEDLIVVGQAVSKLAVNAETDTSNPDAFTIRNHSFSTEEPGAFTIRNHSFNAKEPGAFTIRNYSFTG
jgi:hypothetical protein